MLKFANSLRLMGLKSPFRRPGVSDAGILRRRRCQVSVGPPSDDADGNHGRVRRGADEPGMELVRRALGAWVVFPSYCDEDWGICGRHSPHGERKHQRYSVARIQ